MNSNLNYHTVYNLSCHAYKYSNTWSLRGEKSQIWGLLDFTADPDVSVASPSPLVILRHVVC